MNNLEIDIETYSSIDLMKCGVYKYSEAEDFEIFLFGYSIDGSDVQVIDLACGEEIPEDILSQIHYELIVWRILSARLFIAYFQQELHCY